MESIDTRKSATARSTVLGLLKARQRNTDPVRSRADTKHLALVVEGFAMDAALPAGMVYGLATLGLHRCFDSVHGYALGSIVAAYFSTGQSEELCNIVLNELASDDFLVRQGKLSTRRTVNADWLVDYVIAKRRPLRWGNADNRLPLFLSPPLSQSGDAVCPNNKADVLERIRNSVALSNFENVVTRDSIESGSSSDALVQSVEAAKATHVLVVTSGGTWPTRNESPWLDWALHTFGRPYELPVRASQFMNTAASLAANGVIIDCIDAPSFGITPFCRDTVKLQTAIRLGELSLRNWWNN